VRVFRSMALPTSAFSCSALAVPPSSSPAGKPMARAFSSGVGSLSAPVLWCLTIPGPGCPCRLCRNAQLSSLATKVGNTTLGWPTWLGARSVGVTGMGSHPASNTSLAALGCPLASSPATCKTSQPRVLVQISRSRWAIEPKLAASSSTPRPQLLRHDQPAVPHPRPLVPLSADVLKQPPQGPPLRLLKFSERGEYSHELTEEVGPRVCQPSPRSRP